MVQGYIGFGVHRVSGCWVADLSGRGFRVYESTATWGLGSWALALALTLRVRSFALQVEDVRIKAELR